MIPNRIERTLALLQHVERHASTSEQHDALKNSRIAFYFILGRGESDEFEEFFASFDPASLTPVLSFTTKEEADAWLLAHPDPPHGAIIGIEDARYHVAYSRALEHRKLLRLPSMEELERMQEAGEGEEAEEEPSPPSPRPDMRFSFFALFNATCFHLYEMERRMSLPEELEALRTARIAFEFVMHVGEHHGFEDYLETLQHSRTSSPLQFFPTREEAGTWLETQPEPPPPTVVAIGSELYSVGYNRKRGLRVLIRIPTQPQLQGENRT